MASIVDTVLDCDVSSQSTFDESLTLEVALRTCKSVRALTRIFVVLCTLSVCPSVFAQSRAQSRPASETQVSSDVVVSDRIGRGISISRENIIKLFQPLSTSKFSFKDVEIVENEGRLFLVASYENSSTEQYQSIGISLIEDNGRLVINRTAETVKCSETNRYCTCLAPICTCVREGDGTGPTYVESCGKLVIEKEQIANFNNAIAATATAR